MPRDFFGNYPIVAGLGFSRDVLLLDDAEGTFTWVVGGTGGDDVHEYLAAAAWQGTYGMHLKTRTTSTTEDDYVIAQKLFDWPSTDLLVARLRVTPVVVANTKGITITLAADDGADGYTGAIQLAPDGSKVNYYNSGGSWVELTDLAMTYYALHWLTVELALDLKAHTYRHLRFNGWDTDLSTLSLKAAGASASRGAYLQLAAIASAAGPGELYADNIVVHQIAEA